MQFAHNYAQSGIDTAIGKDIMNSKEAIEFLFGRIYDYLNPESQKIFSGMGVLADSEVMTNLLDKVMYILNMKNNSKFCENVDEIEKSRLIERLLKRLMQISGVK